MSVHATRGMSAPPEVVVDAATDPARRGGWLPAHLRVEPVQSADDGGYQVGLSTESGAAGVLQVRPGASGGSSVDLRVEDADTSPEDILTDLDRTVADNLNAG
jgi:hypothetical protein